MTTPDLISTYVCLYGCRNFDADGTRAELAQRGVNVTALDAIAQRYVTCYKWMNAAIERHDMGMYERLMKQRARLSDMAHWRRLGGCEVIRVEFKQLELFREAA